MPNCPHCSRTFGSAHAVKIHVTKAHGSAAPAAKGGKRKAARRNRSLQSHQGLTEVSTDELLAELGRRAKIADRLKTLVG